MITTPQYNHSEEAKREYSRIFWALLDHPAKVIIPGKKQTAKNGDTYIEITFGEPLNTGDDEERISSLYLEFPTLFVYQSITGGNLDPWRLENGEQLHMRHVLYAMGHAENKWIPDGYLRLIDDFFACERSLEFALSADAAFEAAADSTHQSKPCRSSFFGIATAKLENAIRATGGALEINLTAPILRGNKEALVDALAAIRDGGSPRWSSDSVFYLVETKRPIRLRQIPGSPMQPCTLAQNLLLVSSKAPQQLFSCEYKVSATSEETENTELFLNCIIPEKGEEHKQPFRLAEMKLSSVSDGSLTGLTLSALFQSLLDEGKLTDAQKRTIMQSGVIRKEKPNAPTPAKKGLPDYETEIVQVPNTPAINTMIDMLNKPRNIDEGRYVRKEAADPIVNPGATNLIYQGKDDMILWEVPDWDKLFPQAIPNGPKVFDIMMREVQRDVSQETIFIPLGEFVQNGVYSDLDSAYEGVKSICEKLFQVEVSGESMVYAGKEKKRKPFEKSRVISGYGIKNSQLKVSFAPIYRQSAPYFTVMPDWAFRLPSNAYILARYFMEVARKKAGGVKIEQCFTLSIEAIRIKLGLPNPESERDLKRRIREPIEAALKALNDEQQLHDQEWLVKAAYDLKEGSDSEPTNTREWLKGSWVITVSPKIAENMSRIHQAKQKALSSGKKKAAKSKPS